jgi:ATP-binding cassette subfamily B protein
MLWLDWKLALMALAAMPVLGVTIALLTPGTRRAQQRAIERAAHFEAHTIEAIDAIQSLRSSRAESQMRLRGEARFMEVLDATFDSEIYRLWSSTGATLLAGLASLSLLWAGGHGVLAVQLSLGQLMALYTLFGTVIGPVERLAGANQAIQEALVATDRVGEILALPQELDKEGGVDRDIEGGIEFRAVRFGYPGKQPLFNALTLELPHGECSRIAGSSGSGKSTLVRLLVRFYEIEAGQILIDGIDIRDYSLASLRRQVVYLSQEAALLSVSVADNIRLGHPEATPDTVRRAALRAGAHDFIQAAPNGYDSLVGERGLSLSGGERQRIVLARAIVADPAILILDEPTNHLDPPSVRAVADIIEDRRRRRRTTLLISHDTLSTDRIIQIDAQTKIAG